MKSGIYMIYGDRGADMAKSLLEAARPAIPDGCPIVIKPNLVVARPASEGATTHVEIAEGVLAYLRDHGYTDFTIMEGAWVGASTRAAFQACGYAELARKFGARLVDTKHDEIVSISTPIGNVNICKSAYEARYIINLPVLKGHCQTVLTCALKNLKGLIPDSEKRRFHTMGLHKPIAALAAALRPALTLVDSLCGDLNFEEGGHPVKTSRMMLGYDPVQLDALGCALMGIDPRDVPYIALAEQYGAGKAAYDVNDIINLNQPMKGKIPKANSGLMRRLAENIEENQACSACYGNLIHALGRLDEQGRLRAAPTCYVGQGFQGVKGESGLGIGKCCAGMKEHVPGCPPSAEAILRHLR